MSSPCVSTLSFLLQTQILGMVPDDLLSRADEHHRLQFFEQVTPSGRWTIKQRENTDIIVPSTNPIASLKSVVEKEAQRKKKYSASDEQHSARQYGLFVDLISRMLAFRPTERITPTEALQHSFITER